MNKFEDIKIGDFLDELASSSPTPGGGAAAAFVGAISASLVAMVAILTIGKKGYESVQDEMKNLRSKALKIQRELTDLAAKDSASYNQAMKAYKIAKDEKGREDKIQAALKGATLVPLKVFNLAKEIILLADEATKKGNKNAISDGNSAIHLAKGAGLSALENIRINLKYIKDSNWKEKIEAEVEE